MKRINSMQGIRTIAFIQVFFVHCCYWLDDQSIYLIWLNRIPWSMVLFFMLSGFGMVLGYQNRMDSIPNRPIEWCKFVLKRLKKIYPLHLTMLLASVIFFSFRVLFIHEVIDLKVAIVSLLSQIFLFLSWIPIEEYYSVFNPIVWTLSSLVFCYFLAIPSLYFLRQRKDYRKITILLIILKLAVASLPVSHYWIFRWPVMRFTDFLLGMLSAEFYLSKKDIKNAATLQLLSTLGVIATVLLSTLYYCGIGFTYPDAILAIPVFFFFRYIPYDGQIGRLLGNRVLVWVANISMELYLIHPMVIRYLWAFWIMIGRELDIILVLLEAVTSFVLAFAWNRLVTQKISR